MPRPLCSRDEDILRAVYEAHWDGRRLDSELFEGRGISVSRLTILAYPELCAIFKRTIKSPIVKTAEIKVGDLQDIGNTHTPSKELTVEVAPSTNNPAHAEIPQKISRSLARKIVSVVTLRELTS
jgi:hypothetical protein